MVGDVDESPQVVDMRSLVAGLFEQGRHAFGGLARLTVAGEVRLGVFNRREFRIQIDVRISVGKA